jgi:hypothetical protein
MQHIARVILLLSFIAVGLLGQQPTEDETGTWGRVGNFLYHFSNGKAWKQLDLQSRVTLIQGLEEGIMLAVREADKNVREDQVMILDRTSKNLTIKGFRMSDIVSQIDTFYSDSANVRVPITDGYQYPLIKMKGESAVELEKYAEQLRKTYNNQE